MNLADHADHVWSQQGRCVYCDTCNTRLYQGKLPARGQQKKEAENIDSILEPFRQKILAKSKKEWEERTPEQNQAWEEGRVGYVKGESIMDRLRRGSPHKGTDLASWFNRGWHSAEGAWIRASNGH